MQAHLARNIELLVCARVTNFVLARLDVLCGFTCDRGGFGGFLWYFRRLAAPNESAIKQYHHILAYTRHPPILAAYWRVVSCVAPRHASARVVDADPIRRFLHSTSLRLCQEYPFMRVTIPSRQTDGSSVVFRAHTGILVLRVL